MCSWCVVTAGANRVLLVRNNTHFAVLAAMRAHTGVADVQRVACRVLWTLGPFNGDLLLCSNHAHRPLHTITDQECCMHALVCV